MEASNEGRAGSHEGGPTGSRQDGLARSRRAYEVSASAAVVGVGAVVVGGGCDALAAFSGSLEFAGATPSGALPLALALAMPLVVTLVMPSDGLSSGVRGVTVGGVGGWRKKERGWTGKRDAKRLSGSPSVGHGGGRDSKRRYTIDCTFRVGDTPTNI